MAHKKSGGSSRNGRDSNPAGGSASRNMAEKHVVRRATIHHSPTRHKSLNPGENVGMGKRSYAVRPD